MNGSAPPPRKVPAKLRCGGGVLRSAPALKARSRWPDPVEDDEHDTRASNDPAPDADLELSRVRSALVTAMGSLSPEQRAVVDLTYFHGLGYREIAEILGCPVDTVKTRMFHARRRLRQALPGTLADWL